VASRDDMGRGYTRRHPLVLDHAFGALGLHKMWLMVFRHNERKRRIYGKLGFVEEGVRGTTTAAGTTWCAGILACEWPALRDGV
jgi:RimJ/RimL family protein N-acetyltransferase